MRWSWRTLTLRRELPGHAGTADLRCGYHRLTGRFAGRAYANFSQPRCRHLPAHALDGFHGRWRKWRRLRFAEYRARRHRMKPRVEIKRVTDRVERSLVAAPGHKHQAGNDQPSAARDAMFSRSDRQLGGASDHIEANSARWARSIQPNRKTLPQVSRRVPLLACKQCGGATAITKKALLGEATQCTPVVCIRPAGL